VSIPTLSSEPPLYWPFILVGVCGVILVAISVFAFLLIKGHPDPSPEKRKTPALPSGKRSKKSKHSSLSVQMAEVSFYRIGHINDVRNTTVPTNQWISVGSGSSAGFRLDPDDQKLASGHFQIQISDSVRLVEAAEAETFVNGVPISKLGPVYAASGDLIRAGSFEYRIIISSGVEKEITE